MIKQITFNFFFILLVLSALLSFLKFPIIFSFYLIWAISIWFILRIYLCGSCEYYGKSCYTDWGIISKFLTKKRKFSKGYIHLANIYWIGIILLPILTWLIAFVRNYNLNYILVLLFFISLSIIFVFHSKACKVCKNRNKCRR